MHLSISLLTVGLLILAVLVVICIIRWLSDRNRDHENEDHLKKIEHHDHDTKKDEVYQYPKKEPKKRPPPYAVHTPNIPRQPASSSKPVIRPQVKTQAPPSPQKKTQASARPQVKSQNAFADAEVVEVQSSLDLFSPKEDILAELGMTQEELDEELAKYKAEHEYKERRLPVNKNFNMEDYKESRKVLREAPKNDMISMAGSKRDELQRDLLKKQALATLRKRDTSFGISTTFAEKSHNPPMPARRGSLGTVVHA